MGNYPN